VRRHFGRGGDLYLYKAMGYSIGASLLEGGDMGKREAWPGGNKGCQTLRRMGLGRQVRQRFQHGHCQGDGYSGSGWDWMVPKRSTPFGRKLAWPIPLCGTDPWESLKCPISLPARTRSPNAGRRHGRRGAITIVGGGDSVAAINKAEPR
jgi:hypothetical protein